MIVDRRLYFRKGLSHLYLPFYDLLCEELGPHWQPFQGIRTLSQQEALYAQGRTTSGPNVTPEKPLGDTVTNAPPGHSAHNYGCATDWTLWHKNTPIWNRKDARWPEYFSAVERVGLRAGKEFNDWPHNELKISAKWSRVFEQSKLVSAEEFIREKMLT